MTGAARAYYGAAVGALLSLILHPVSRPYMTSMLTDWGRSDARSSSSSIIANLNALPTPASADDLDTISVWMVVGAAALRDGRLSVKDQLKLAELAGYASAKDATNAFWPQIRATFLSSAGQLGKAKSEWLRASRLDRWNDMQTARLLKVRDAFAAEAGAHFGWQLRSAYRERSSGPAAAIVAFGKSMLQGTSTTEISAVLVRFATAMNGRLIRDGGRSLEIGRLGSNLLEAASYPPSLGVVTSYRRRLLARQELEHALQRAGYQAESEQLRRAFGSNDAWGVLTEAADLENPLDRSTALSLFSATMPGVSLIIACFAAGVWLAGLFLERFKPLQHLVRPPIAPLIGIVLAVWVYRATGLVLASITTVLCFAFLVFSPENERKHPPDDLGPLFGFVLGILALGVFVSLAAFLVGVSTAGIETLGPLGVPREYYHGSTLFLGLAGIMMGLLLLTAPSWGLGEKIATPKVAAKAFALFGSGLCASALAVAVASGPLAVYFDRQASDVLLKHVENEPNYYLTREP